MVMTLAIDFTTSSLDLMIIFLDPLLINLFSSLINGLDFHSCLTSYLPCIGIEIHTRTQVNISIKVIVRNTNKKREEERKQGNMYH